MCKLWISSLARSQSQWIRGRTPFVNFLPLPIIIVCTGKCVTMAHTKVFKYKHTHTQTYIHTYTYTQHTHAHAQTCAYMSTSYYGLPCPHSPFEVGALSRQSTLASAKVKDRWQLFVPLRHPSLTHSLAHSLSLSLGEQYHHDTKLTILLLLVNSSTLGICLQNQAVHFCFPYSCHVILPVKKKKLAIL